MSKDPSSARGHALPVATRRNFRLSSLEILVTVLIFVGVLYLVTMWATNMFNPGEEAATPAAPPGAMVERALASSEKVLAEQISQSRDMSALRKQVEALQAQTRKTHGAGSADPVDAAQDRRLDEVDRRLDDLSNKVGQHADNRPLLARVEKLEHELAAKPGAAPLAAGAVAALGDPQLLARIEKLEKDLAAHPATPPAPAPASDPKLLARVEKLEKDLAAKPTPAPAASPGGPASDPQLLARIEKLEKDLAAHPAAPNPAAAALAQQEQRLQRLEAGLQEAREAAGRGRPAAPDSQVLARLERLEKAQASAKETAATAPPAPVSLARSETKPPAPAPAPAPRADSKAASNKPSRTEAEARKASIAHKVKNGETLGGLARRYKVSESDIIRWNSMGARRLLLKGESLVIYPGQNS